LQQAAARSGSGVSGSADQPLCQPAFVSGSPWANRHQPFCLTFMAATWGPESQ
jgi:hypothetical protein